MVGDPNTGMLVGQTQTFPDGVVQYDEYRIGGTSLSSPLFAGVMALADQARAATTTASSTRRSTRSPGPRRSATSCTPSEPLARRAGRLRRTASTPTDGRHSLRTFDFQGLTINTRPGYDDVTGLGTPNGAAFINALK